jgi:hypothetical protein
MPDFLLQITLQTLAVATPVIIVWIIGIVMAIVRWKKAPKTALLTLLGVLLAGFVFVLEIGWNIFGVRWINTNRSVFNIARMLMIVIPLTLNLLKAASWIFILLAIFSKPKKDSKKQQEQEAIADNQQALSEPPQQEPE